MNNIHKFLPFTKAPTPQPEDEPKELVEDEQPVSEVKKEERERKQCKQCNFFCYTSKGFRIHMTRIHSSSTTATPKEQVDLVESMQTMSIDATKMNLVVDQQSLIEEQHQKIQELEKENAELKRMLQQMKDASFEQLQEHYLTAATALNTFNNLIQQIKEQKKL